MTDPTIPAPSTTAVGMRLSPAGAYTTPRNRRTLTRSDHGRRHDPRQEVPLPDTRRVGLRPEVRGPEPRGRAVGQALLVRLDRLRPRREPAGGRPHPARPPPRDGRRR